MRVELYPTDLKPEYQKKDERFGMNQRISLEEITFDHLSGRAQKAVRAAKQGVFIPWEGRMFKLINAPSILSENLIEFFSECRYAWRELTKNDSKSIFEE